MTFSAKKSSASGTPDYGAYRPETILELCADGRLGREALIAEDKILGYGKWYPVTSVPEFEQAIAEYEAAQAIAATKKKKHDAEHNPAPALLLYLQVKQKVLGPYTVGQIKGMWNSGHISADACFKHPEYEDWFPCLSLFSTDGEEGGGVASERWEYYCLEIKVKGARSGVLSYFQEKSAGESSLNKLADLGREGWELVGMVPITHGALNVVNTDAALAFLKRRL